MFSTCGFACRLQFYLRQKGDKSDGDSEQGLHVPALGLEGTSSYPMLLWLLRFPERRLVVFQVIWHYSLESRLLRASAFPVAYKTKTDLFEAGKTKAVRVHHFR